MKSISDMSGILIYGIDYEVGALSVLRRLTRNRDGRLGSHRIRKRSPQAARSPN
jgi:hypothetical protein